MEKIPKFPPTVRFGRYNFVKIDESIKFPVFRCCGGRHGHDEHPQQVQRLSPIANPANSSFELNLAENGEFHDDGTNFYFGF